jgi:hypothetical protein
MMARYSYETDDGDVIEESFAMGEAPCMIRLPDGRVARKNLSHDYGTPLEKKQRSARRLDVNTYPQKAYSIAVDPSQAKSANELLVSRGAKPCFNDMGVPEIADRADRNAHCKARGIADFDAGYGDVAPSSG